MRIALFSDIHSNYHALEAVLEDMKGQSVDKAICLGDITLKGPLPKQCVDRVRDLGCPVVLGNTDGCYHAEYHPSRFPTRNRSQVALREDYDRHVAALTAADRAWLIGFPLTHTEWVEGVRLDFFHAAPHHNYTLVMPWAEPAELEALRLADETLLSAFGHNHRPFVRFQSGRVVVNSGSVGLPFDGDPRPSYAIVEIGGGGVSAQIRRVRYDAEGAIRAARDSGMVGWELFAHTARTGEYPG